MTATLLSQTGKITRQELQVVPVPHGTSTHQPLSHYQIDAVSIGVDRMQRNFEPLAGHIELVRQTSLTDDAAKLIIYQAFVEGSLAVPRHLARTVHENYFQPRHEEFTARTAWSLSNAFTSAFKELDAVPQFRATAKLGAFLTRTVPQ